MVIGRAVIRSSPGARPRGTAGVIGFSKYFSRMRAATGAAESAPKPPRSIVTATTILGSSAGATATYQAWSGSGKPPSVKPRSAVPVLPATSIGKFPKTP